MFSTNPRTNSNFSFTFILSSANPLNLDQSKTLSFDKELRDNHEFLTFQRQLFLLAPLAVVQRAYVMVHCLSCVCPSARASVCALTFSLNIVSETNNLILMKFNKNVAAMVFFRIL